MGETIRDRDCVKISTAKARAWKACSRYIREKAAVDGMCQCVTCGEWHPIYETDAGHFISKTRSNSIFLVEENIHPQCQHCNRYVEGNKHLYALYMIDTYGREKVEELEALARTKVNYRVKDYLELEVYYKEALKAL